MSGKAPQRIPSFYDGKVHYGHPLHHVSSPKGAPREPKAMRRDANETARIRHENQFQWQLQAQEQPLQQQQALQHPMALDQRFSTLQSHLHAPRTGWGFLNPAFVMGRHDWVMPAPPGWEARMPGPVRHMADFGFPDSVPIPATSGPSPSLNNPSVTDGCMQSMQSNPTLEPNKDEEMTSMNNRQIPPSYKKHGKENTQEKSALYRSPTNVPTAPKISRVVKTEGPTKFEDESDKVKNAAGSVANYIQRRKKKKKKKAKQQQQPTQTNSQRHQEKSKKTSSPKPHKNIPKEKVPRNAQEQKPTLADKSRKVNKQHTEPPSARLQTPPRIPPHDKHNRDEILHEQDKEMQLLLDDHKQQLEQLGAGKYYRKAYLMTGGTRRTWRKDKNDLRGWMLDRHVKERARLEEEQQQQQQRSRDVVLREEGVWGDDGGEGGRKRKRSVTSQAPEQTKFPRVEGASAAVSKTSTNMGLVKDRVDAVEKEVGASTRLESARNSEIQNEKWLGDGLMSLLG